MAVNVKNVCKIDVVGTELLGTVKVIQIAVYVGCGNFAWSVSGRIGRTQKSPDIRFGNHVSAGWLAVTDAFVQIVPQGCRRQSDNTADNCVTAARVCGCRSVARTCK